MDLIKLESGVYEIKEYTEWWEVRIYDYSDKYMYDYDGSGRKYHRVAADSSERCYELMDRSYAEYNDKEHIFEHFTLDLENIVTNKIVQKRFKPDKGALDQKAKFIQEHSDFSEHDLNMIFRYKEMKQKDRHNRAKIRALYDLAETTRRAGNNAAGLPMDW